MWTNDRRLIVLGAGGHARVVQELVRALGGQLDGFVSSTAESSLDGVPYLGTDADLATIDASTVVLVNGIGSIAAPSIRREVYLAARSQGFDFVTLIDPGAHVRRNAELGTGVQVLPGAVIGAGARIGDNVIINSGAVVEHDTEIGAHCHLSPGVAVAGSVTIEDGVHVGIGATIVQGVRVGSGSTIGAGAVVIRDIPAGSVAVGVPAVARATERRETRD